MVQRCNFSRYGGVAQMAEQGTHKPCVVGSSPTPATSDPPHGQDILACGVVFSPAGPPDWVCHCQRSLCNPCLSGSVPRNRRFAKNTDHAEMPIALPCAFNIYDGFTGLAARR